MHHRAASPARRAIARIRCRSQKYNVDNPPGGERSWRELHDEAGAVRLGGTRSRPDRRSAEALRHADGTRRPRTAPHGRAYVSNEIVRIRPEAVVLLSPTFPLGGSRRSSVRRSRIFTRSVIRRVSSWNSS